VAVAAAALLIPATGADAASARTAVHAQAVPAPAVGLAPGGSVAWRPEGRQVLGRPVVYRGNSGGVDVAWLDPSLLKPMFVPGTGDPGGPWAAGGQIPPEVRGQVVAAFNGGFQLQDLPGGFYNEGRTVKSLVPGQASLVTYRDGRATVGEWGRDVELTPDVVSVRQNLGLLVDGGRPVATAGSPGAWGGSVAGVATARSGVGVDANGALVVAQARVSPQGLADALVAAGAVRGMQMDINPDWTSFALYEPNPDGTLRGARVMGTGGPGGLWLSPYARDFFVMLIKPAVAPGGSGTVGNTPVAASGKVPVKK
jgi:Phosphodiester glycosidase